jgi:hypothetical protein
MLVVVVLLLCMKVDLKIKNTLTEVFFYKIYFCRFIKKCQVFLEYSDCQYQHFHLKMHL